MGMLGYGLYFMKELKKKFENIYIRSGRESWIGSCFPSVVIRARVSRLTATRFSANREITATFSAKSASLAEGERCC